MAGKPISMLKAISKPFKWLAGLLDLLFVPLFIALGVAISIKCAYDLDNMQPKFATMNLSKVVELQEASLTMKGLKGDELDREAKVFALSLQDSIKRIQDDCKCTLLVSSAVIGDHKLDDYTDDLIARLKLDPRAGDIVRSIYEMNLTKKTGA